MPPSPRRYHLTLGSEATGWRKPDGQVALGLWTDRRFGAGRRLQAAPAPYGRLSGWHTGDTHQTGAGAGARSCLTHWAWSRTGAWAFATTNRMIALFKARSARDPCAATSGALPDTGAAARYSNFKPYSSPRRRYAQTAARLLGPPARQQPMGPPACHHPSCARAGRTKQQVCPPHQEHLDGQNTDP